MKQANIIALIQILIMVFLFTGWIKSIIKFTKCDFKEPYKAEVIYGIGTFIPLTGGIIGWINIDD